VTVRFRADFPQLWLSLFLWHSEGNKEIYMGTEASYTMGTRSLSRG